MDKISRLSLCGALAFLVIASTLGVRSSQAGDAPDQTKSQAVLLEEYRDRRQKLPDKDFKAHMELAAWCEANGFKDQAESLYRAAVALNPKNAEANEKAGNKLVQTPKGEMWLSPRQQVEYEKESKAYTVPEGDTSGYYKAWERYLPLRVRMRDQNVDPEKARAWPLGFTRVRKMLVNDLSLQNRSPGAVEITRVVVFYGIQRDVKEIGKTLKPGRRWNYRDEQPLLATGYSGDRSVRRWRPSMRMAVYLTAQSNFGHTLRLQYMLEVPEKYEKALRAADAKRIRKGLNITLGEDEGLRPSGVRPTRGRIDVR